MKNKPTPNHRRTLPSLDSLEASRRFRQMFNTFGLPPDPRKDIPMELTLQSQWVTPLNPLSSPLTGVFATLLLPSLVYKLPAPPTVSQLLGADHPPDIAPGTFQASPDRRPDLVDTMLMFTRLSIFSRCDFTHLTVAYWPPDLWPSALDFQNAFDEFPMLLATQRSPFSPRYHTSGRPPFTWQSFTPLALASTAPLNRPGPHDCLLPDPVIYFIVFPTTIAYFPCLDDTELDLRWLREAGYTVIT